MENNASLDRKLDDVLERLNYLGMVIRNLKDRSGTLITDVGEIDERLFKEIANYEMSTEELKRDFILLLTQDARRLEDICVSNINLFDRVSEEFDKIDETLNFIRDHETREIKTSEELQEFVEKAKIRLKDIRGDMNEKVRAVKEEKKHYEKTQAMHRAIK